MVGHAIRVADHFSLSSRLKNSEHNSSNFENTLRSTLGIAINLFPVDGAVPAFGLLSEERFALSWHGLSAYRALNRAFARLHNCGLDQKT